MFPFICSSRGQLPNSIKHHTPPFTLSLFLNKLDFLPNFFQIHRQQLIFDLILKYFFDMLTISNRVVLLFNYLFAFYYLFLYFENSLLSLFKVAFFQLILFNKIDVLLSLIFYFLLQFNYLFVCLLQLEFQGTEYVHSFRIFILFELKVFLSSFLCFCWAVSTFFNCYKFYVKDY